MCFAKVLTEKCTVDPCPSRGTPKTAADHYSATSPSPPTEPTASVATQSQRPRPTPPSQPQTIRPKFLGCARWEVHCRSIHPCFCVLRERAHKNHRRHLFSLMLCLWGLHTFYQQTEAFRRQCGQPGNCALQEGGRQNRRLTPRHGAAATPIPVEDDSRGAGERPIGFSHREKPIGFSTFSMA